MSVFLKRRRGFHASGCRQPDDPGSCSLLLPELIIDEPITRLLLPRLQNTTSNAYQSSISNVTLVSKA
jgi:hypothetical protein